MQMEPKLPNGNDTVVTGGSSNGNSNININININREEHEKALQDLIDSATREINTLRYYISYYTSQLEEAEKRLRDAESKLARLQAQTNASSSTTESLFDVGTKTVKTVKTGGGSNIPIHRNEGSSKNQHQPKPQLPKPAVSPKIRLPISRVPLLGSRSSDKSHRLSTQKENIEIKVQGTKRKFEHKEHKELIPLICKTSSPCSVNLQISKHIPSQHKRKLRSLALCPVNDQLFATSALDGVVNLWEVHSSGSRASLLSTTDCVSPKQRRWPEDIAWHPDGNSLFSAYSADGEESQISIMNLSRVQGEEEGRVNFLEDKPHVKGIINSIVFLPWENTRFVTGGTDHAVILWGESGENKWKPDALHRNLHSSAVMGIAGMQQKQIVLSAGKDRRILGYDACLGRRDFMHQIDSKCLSVLPNPCDFNLFMVQTGTPERQLRLFDIRTKGTELHAFGWKQESSESQSALINQSWSPNGLYITSGSADPMIHIFDIRYNGHRPSQSIEAHQKRVFKAMWLKSLPLLISISSDLNIGLHKVV